MKASGNAVKEPAPSIEEGDELFQVTADGVNFRTVGWLRASVIFLKIIFATGVLTIPTSMYALGAVGGALSVIGWGALNTYIAIIQGDFRNNHPKCYSIADMAQILGGVALRELVGFLFIASWILCTGGGILGVSIAINALSMHAACSVWWSFLATIIVASVASIRKFHTLGWPTWVGFVSIFSAVFIVVVGVTTRDRPAAAPQTGDYDLGYYAIGSAGFAAGMTSTANIFVASAGTSAFLPVISEMKNPKDYRKAVFLCMTFVTAAYLSFSLVVYRWCGKWVANPSLGSAGGTIKKVAYGVGLAGLGMSACLYLHVGAKYLFVRVLRNTGHLQANTFVHWATWLSCTFGLASLSFILAEAIPIFSYILALTGTICFAPIALTIPGFLWLYDHGTWRKGTVVQQLAYWAHWILPFLGAFICVGGTYGVVKQIIDAYASGEIGKFC
ncbi:putative N amino acid transport system protein [Thermoascus aurantiacus ATCC 26904]